MVLCTVCAGKTARGEVEGEGGEEEVHGAGVVKMCSSQYVPDRRAREGAPRIIILQHNVHPEVEREKIEQASRELPTSARRISNST